MKHILSVLLFLAALTATAKPIDAEASLMAMPPFERAVAIIKHYETLHVGKGQYIGYGHLIQPGEPYRRNQSLTPAQADALLRQDLLKFCASFRQFGKDSLLLATLAYNVGPGTLLGYKGHPKSTLVRKFEDGERDASVLQPLYARFSRYKGRPHRLLRLRRLVEFHLLYQP